MLGAMSPGIIELITFLLGLSGLGFQPNPKRRHRDAALEYADAPMLGTSLSLSTPASLIPGNYKIV